MSEQLPRMSVYSGQRTTPLTSFVLVPNRKPGSALEVYGYRFQMTGVSNAGDLEFMGSKGTKISGKFHVLTTGLAFVEDRLNVLLQDDEDILITSTAAGTLTWAVNTKVQ